MAVLDKENNVALIKYYVTLSIDNDRLSDEWLDNTMQVIKESVEDCADELDGVVYDLEIK